MLRLAIGPNDSAVLQRANGEKVVYTSNESSDTYEHGATDENADVADTS